MKEKKPYDGIKRPTVPLAAADHRAIAHFCIENDISIGEFLKRAALYCVEKNIVPKKTK